MRVLFLGFAVSDEMFENVLATDRGMPAQTQRFGWAVVDALRAAGIETYLVSAEPVADFPNNKRAVVQGRQFTQAGVRGRSLSFVNLTGFKHVTRYAAAVAVENGMSLECFDAVLVHGVHSPFLWAALRIGARRRIPVVAILTDPPSIRTQYDSQATMLMKRIDSTPISRALARMDGVLVLAPPLAADFAPGLPSLWMEGIAPTLVNDSNRLVHSSRKTMSVVYAGGMRQEYGVLDLADAVRMSALPWTATFYGRGPEVAAIKEHSSTNSRISYGGTVPTAALAGIYRDADLLINPRRLEEFTNYSFPSKLLEYMASGTPVMTTRLPNLPDDYEGHVLFADSGPEGLARAIDSAFHMADHELDLIGRRARQFVIRTRGSHAQGVRLRDFLSGLAPTGIPGRSLE